MLWQRITLVLSFIFILAAGVLANLLEIYNTYLERVLPGSRSRAATVFFVLWILTLIFLACVYLHYRRKALYAEVLSDVYRIAVDIERLRGQETLVGIEEKSKQIVNQLAQIMFRVTKTPCSVCIKTISVKRRGDDEFLPVADTLCRDDVSLNTDREILIKDTTNWVYNNTAFKKLHTEHPERTRVFFCNHLPFLKGYENTSFTAYGGEPPKFRLIRMLPGVWPLPYKSTIIASILSEPCNSEEQTENRRVIGFICLDAKPFEVFDKRYDEIIVKTIADALSPVLQQHKRLQKANETFTNVTTTRTLTTTQGG